jgi:hypothetical protein
VKLVGAPPDSYFDFWGFNFQTPMNGSFAGAVTGAGRGVSEAGAGFAGRDDFCGAAAGFAGRDDVCGAATNPDGSTNVAIRSIKAHRELRMGHLLRVGSTLSASTET